jgi:hypothetical protein
MSWNDRLSQLVTVGSGRSSASSVDDAEYATEAVPTTLSIERTTSAERASERVYVRTVRSAINIRPASELFCLYITHVGLYTRSHQQFRTLRYTEMRVRC